MSPTASVNSVSMVLRAVPGGPVPCFMDSSCRRCDLSSGSVESVCIPMRSKTVPIPTIGKCPTALLCIGEAPGPNEDREGVSFIGKSGQILDDWMSACELSEEADIYYANVIRCRLPKDHTISKVQFDACRQWLAIDVKWLSHHYKSVVLLALGASACKALGFSSLRSALSRQGDRITLGLAGCSAGNGTSSEAEGIPLFATYHPASTLPGRSPNNIFSIEDHLDMLCRYIRGSLPTESYGTPTARQLTELSPSASLQAVDIETYGKLSTYCPQTVFHPAKSLSIDGLLSSKSLVQIVGMAWWGKKDVVSGCINFQNNSHRRALKRWAHGLLRQNPSSTLLFMNAQFDIQYLRFVGVPIDHNIPVEDLAVWNYLASDMRTERSLKTLAPLLGVARFGDEDKAKGGEYKRYKTVKSRDLWAYCQKDCEATLKGRDVLRQQIADWYGKDSPKLSEYTKDWYSRLIWLCVYMSEAGVAFDLPKLESVRSDLEKDIKALRKIAFDQGLKLSGTGAGKAAQALVDEAITNLRLESHPELTRHKTGWSTSDGNLRLIKSATYEEHAQTETFPGPVEEVRNKVIMLQSFRALRKLLTSYVTPMIGPWKWKSNNKIPDYTHSLIGNLDDRGDTLQGYGPQRRIGYAFPTWYVTPAPSSEVDDDESGTKQGRITCKKPALQTLPRADSRIQDCMTSRYKGGCLSKIDLSQVELRVAALLSGDSDMMGEYERGIDRHTARAVEMFPNWAGQETHPDFKNTWRQIGKTVNFLIVYRGGAHRLRQTLLEEVGFDMDIQECKRIVATSRARYPELDEWQTQLIMQVSRDGYWADPILGQGRMFVRSATLALTDYESTICNVPVQNAAANLMLDAQATVCFHIIESGLDAHVTLNGFDAMLTDCKSEMEANAVECWFAEALEKSEYRRRLEDHLGRSVPITYEAEVKTT